MEYISARPHGTLAEDSADLAAVARGDRPPDLIVTNGKLINVHTAEITGGAHLWIARGRIARVHRGEESSARDAAGPDTRHVDAGGMYLAPGFLDSHVHVESSMCTATGFARGVLPRGTTGVFMGPHEIANVLGLKGIRQMLDEAADLPIKLWCTIPSCVPAAPGFEDAGAEIGAEELTETMEWPEVIALGEMMNFPGVINGDEEVHAKLAATYRAGKIATGHYASPDVEAPLNAYVASGVSSCHESVRREEAAAKLRLGMWTMLREGSAWQDVRETIKCVTEEGLDPRHLLLVTDDCHPETILREGHLDRVLRRAIGQGLDPVQAIRAVTLNPAEYYGLSADVGSLSPGKCADVVFLDDLASVSVRRVMVNGRMLHEEGEWVEESPLLGDLPTDAESHRHRVHAFYPEEARHTVRISPPPPEQRFRIPAPEGTEEGQRVQTEVIQVQEAQVGTRRVQGELTVREGRIAPDPERDIAGVFCFDRHRVEGDYGYGFVSGFGFKRGAVASTVAHDSHNLVVVGVDEGSMARAARRICELEGGMVAVDEDEVIGEVPLPVAGLMSDRPIDEVARQVEGLLDAWRRLGCEMESPFMTMALLALPVLPEIRLSNRGLIDTTSFEFIEPVVAE